MKCRICACECEKTDPQYDGLCRTCGQKRETYAAAALTGLIANGMMAKPEDADIVAHAFGMAEMAVAFDRSKKR